MYPVIVTILFLFLSFSRIRKVRSVNSLITGVLLLVFFLGIIEKFNITLYYVNVLIEGLIMILFFKTLISVSNKRKKFNLPGIRIFIIFSVVLFISVLISSSNLYQSYLYYRFFLTPYLFMLIMVNIELPEYGIRRIIDFIQYLFVFQLIATVVKLIVLGTPEQPVGTIIVAGGGVATFIPLIAAGFLLSRYYIYEKKKLFLVLIFVFTLIAYASQKRGTFVFLPAVFVFFIVMLGEVDIRSRAFHKKVIYLVSTFVLSIIILIIGAKKIPMMNPEGSKNGSFDLNFLIESSVEYNTLQGDYAYGRFASFQQVNIILEKSSFVTNLFGFGPETLKGSTRGDGRFERFGVGGTYPGISYQVVQIGYLGAGLWLLLLCYYGLMIFKILKKEKDRYWKSIGMGSLVLIFLAVVDYLTYSTTFIVVYAFSFTIAFSFGLMMRRYYRMNTQSKLEVTSKIKQF
jgi:hypothetical protein